MRYPSWCRPVASGLRGPLTAAVALLLGGAGLAQGQEAAADSAGLAATAAATDSAVIDSVSGISPAGAFLRGSIVPGWGHATTGSLTRGAFYFSMEALSGWMVFKTQRRLGVARDQAALWEDRVVADLAAAGVTDLDAIDAALADHEQVLRFRGLVDARTEQREDWMAIALFTLLLSGVDAFVSSHLKGFPEPLTVEGDPMGGTVELAVRLPLG